MLTTLFFMNNLNGSVLVEETWTAIVTNTFPESSWGAVTTSTTPESWGCIVTTTLGDINTENRRRSVQAYGGCLMLPVADAVIEKVDRRHAAWYYSSTLFNDNEIWVVVPTT